MDAFFNWLSANPTAAIILLVVISLVVAIFVAFSTVALLQGREVQYWPPKISAKTFAIEIGSLNIPADHPKKHELYEKGFTDQRTVVVHIKFEKAFPRTPKIIVGLYKIDVGDGGINRLLVKVQDPKKDGFDLVFETWKDSRVYDAGACWIALSE
jgi:H-type lectin domain